MLRGFFQGLAWAQDAGNSTMRALPERDFGWGGDIQALGMVFFLLALVMGGFYLLKRFGPNRVRIFGRGMLSVEAQLPLGPRRNVVVVRFLNKRLVLGVTDQQITLLHEAPADHDFQEAFDDSLRTRSTDSH